jgi:hypothetical protein
MSSFNHSKKDAALRRNVIAPKEKYHAANSE